MALRIQAGQFRNRPLLQNATISLIQPLTSLICLFIAYRILTNTVGVEGVGLWSLLVAGSLVARLADVSGSGGLARFVAVELQKADAKNAVASYIHTVTLTTIALNGFAGTLLWLTSGALIDWLVKPAHVSEAHQLLPFAVVGTIFLAPVAATVCSAIDGTQRARERAVLVSISSVASLISSWLLIPRLGAMGFAISQILQQTIVIVLGWTLLRWRVQGMGMFPYRWRQAIFRETVGFGLRLQLMALASLLTEPLTKFVISQWGGLDFVAYYEFAIRILNQIRSLVVTAAQPLIAAVAAARNDPRRLDELLTKSTKLAIVSAVGVCLLSISAGPILSYVMLGKIEEKLLYSLLILAAGFGANTVSIPFYFAALGLGVTRWNMLSQLQAAILIILFSMPMGANLGGYGAIATLTMALISGSAIILIGNGYAIKMMSVIIKNARWILLAGVVIVAACAGAAMLTFKLVN